MTNKALLLDLDDTIFPTRSINKNAFKPFINDLTDKLQYSYSPDAIDNIINDLWDRPPDFVIEKYNIDISVIADSLDILSNPEIQLNIHPYPDYDSVREIKIPKFLITNGISNLQMIKIKSLSIENDFTEIIVNDFMINNITKKDIFNDLMLKYDLTPDSVYVVGDNPDSEIKAGNELNMITIQVLRKNILKGNNAKHYIESFNDLKNIIR